MLGSKGCCCAPLPPCTLRHQCAADVDQAHWPVGEVSDLKEQDSLPSFESVRQHDYTYPRLAKDQKATEKLTSFNGACFVIRMNRRPGNQTSYSLLCTLLVLLTTQDWFVPQVRQTLQRCRNIIAVPGD